MALITKVHQSCPNHGQIIMALRRIIMALRFSSLHPKHRELNNHGSNIMVSAASSTHDLLFAEVAYAAATAHAVVRQIDRLPQQPRDVS